MMMKLTPIAFAALLLPLAGEAAVQAQLDRSRVSPGESLVLSISTDDGSAGQPDLAPLAQDFILQGSGQSSNTQIINGHVSRSISWQIRLQPRHGGTLQIPALAVGSEHTLPLAVQVAQPSPADLAQAAEHVFLEVETGTSEAHSVMLQQQIPYTVRLFYDDSIQGGTINAPAPANATVQQLGDDRKYNDVRHGRAYHVIERHYAIAPERSGSLQIPGASFQGTMAVEPPPDAQPQAGDDSLFDQMLRNSPLAKDPMFRNAFRGMGSMGAMAQVDTRPVSAQGTAITVQVEPRPAASRGNWLPAEEISLHDSWQDQPPSFRAGEPVSRTITIQAKGLSAAQIPPLALPAPANSRVYADAPSNESRTDGQTIYGISKQTVTYIPDASGELKVPAVDLDWWNTRSHEQSHSGLPAMSFRVAPGLPGSAPTQTAATPRPDAAPMAPSLMSRASDWLHGLRWHPEWNIGALLALGLAGLIAWALRGEKGEAVAETAAAAPVPAPAPTRKASLRALEQACRAHDRQAAAQALLDLALAEWPADPPRGLSALASRLDGGAAEVMALDRSLFGHEESWQGDALWRALQGGLRPKSVEPPQDANGLQALYR